MQDRYAFDIGDFSKCGLLRALMAGSRRRLGVLWYACVTSAAEVEKMDGRFIDYPDLRACDAELHDAFRQAVESGRTRSIASLEAVGLWPQGTRFASEIVPSTGDRADRSLWFERAREQLTDCDLVCCDPDNGVAARDSTAEARFSPKHTLLDELGDLFSRGSSLVVYHHFDRSASHAEQARRIAGCVADVCPSAAAVMPFRFVRRSPRLYVLVVQEAHADWLSVAAGRMRDAPWFRDKHFSLVG